jgi:microcystin-dependent protein
MSYEKTNWKARQGAGLDKFTETGRSGNTVVLTNTPDSVTEPGTPFSEDNMNHIEQGIYEAHEELNEKQDKITAAGETEARKLADEDLAERITVETLARVQADEDLGEYIDQTAAVLNSVIDGIQTVPLTGALLTRVINGTTPVAKNLFSPSAVFIADKTLINDTDGTIGVYMGDIDSATIIVETKTISPVSPNEPTLLGNTAYFSNLPLTVNDAVSLGWNTPRVDDYARVLSDETNGGQTVEWYISNIDDGNITWANPVIINTSDYQAQTTAADAGRVLTGGAAAGTHGQSLGIDTEPTQGSKNLISSDAVFNLFDIIYPVGHIYMSVVNTPPSIGKWVAWGSGRVPAGVNAGDTDFNTVEKTGGAKTHTLITAELASHSHTGPSHRHTGPSHSHTGPSHTHSLSSHTHGLPIDNRGTSSGTGLLYNVLSEMRMSSVPAKLSTDSGGTGNTGSSGTGNTGSSGNDYTTYAGTENTGSAGSGSPHNNLQPYITCYMFKRTE